MPDTEENQMMKLRQELNLEYSTRYVKSNDDLGYIKTTWTIVHTVMNSDNYSGDYFSPWSSVEDLINDFYCDILCNNKTHDPQAKRIESLMILHESVIGYLYKKLNSDKTGDFKKYMQASLSSIND